MAKQYSDLELVQKAQNDDKKAAEILFRKYQNLILKASGQYRLRSVRDEAYGEACMGFYEAVLDFDKALGVPFAGYAKSRVYTCLQNLFRRYLRIWQNETASVIICSPEGKSDDKDYDCLKNTINNIFLHEIMIKLPPRQQQIAKYILIDDLNMVQTAKCMGVSVQSVSKNYAKVLSCIKAHYH